MLSAAHAQVRWPEVTQTARPWTRWWWQGSAVDKKNLTAAMMQYKAAGLGGLEITPIYGVKGHEAKFIDFLSPQWMDMLQHTLGEAKRLGMGIDLANATGWPFGGPWVTPEDACKVVYTKKYLLKEGEQVGEMIRFTQPAFYRSESGAKVDLKTLSYPVATNKNLQGFAFDQVRFERELSPSLVLAYDTLGNVSDISAQVDATGKLNWTAPAGNWMLYALFTGYHGKLVERAAPGGEGDVIDHFSEMALQHYLHRFDSAFRGRDITGIRAFFNDSYEVDDARGQSNWTPDFLKEFKIRRGYGLEKYLPQLFSRDSSDIGRRVLVDYRQTISDLLLDNFTKPWQKWSAAKNKMVRNQSHGSPANILDLYAVIDIPETEGADILRFKFATSTAHVMGKPLAAAETATWLNEHFQSSLGDVKQAVDKYFVGGVNHVVWHGTNYSPQGEPWPGWLFYAAVHFTPANPFWKDFHVLNNYVARCQSFLQKGEPDNDILLYFPFNDRIAEPGRDLLHHFDGMAGFEKSSFKTSADWLLSQGYAFDLISDKQIMGLQSKNSSLLTGKVAYKTILVSAAKYMPLETLQKLLRLSEEGATVIFHKQLPVDVPGLADLASQQRVFSRLITTLPFKLAAGNSVSKAAIGKGAFLSGNDLDHLLAMAGIERETLVDRGLQYARRTYAGGHLYFISNPGNTAVNQWVALTSSEKNALLFNPMTLEAGMAKIKHENGQLKVMLQLEPGESCILQSGNKLKPSKAYRYYRPLQQSMIVEGKWQLRFLEGGPVKPADREIPAPLPWTNLTGQQFKDFSGTSEYSIYFNRPLFAADNYLLDLGDVQETAEVRLNGKYIGTALGPAYKLSIPATVIKPNRNFLQVRVTNGMANRVASLERSGVVWKKFYNTNFPARFSQNRGADGLFSAAEWQAKTSGLGGPVILWGQALLK